VKNYSVEQAGSLAQLARQVNEQIAAGREPIGGIAVVQQLTDATKYHGDHNISTLEDAGIVYLQAMISVESSD
jgi:hypothetical protein